MSGPLSNQLSGACMTAIMLCLLTASRAAAAAGDPLFESDELLEVSIAGPFQDILDERHATDYFRGHLSYRDGDETPVDLDVRIRTRGNFRRENCDYPPVWLKFRKSEVRDTLFEGQRRLKLVVHCERGERFEQSVLPMKYWNTDDRLSCAPSMASTVVLWTLSSRRSIRLASRSLCSMRNA